MYTNWRSFTAFLTMWTLADISAETTSCVRPVNANSITLEQIAGVWHHQIFVANSPLNFSIVCDRMEYIFSGNNSGLAAIGYFLGTTGEFSLTIFQLTQLEPGVILSVNPPVTIYLYPMLINELALVVSACLTVNGQLVSQLSSVLTKSKTADRKCIRKLLAKANVTYSHEYFHENSENCYTLRYGC